MLQEGDGERHKDEASHNEVGGHAVHSCQNRHQRPPEVELVLDTHLLSVPQHQRIEPVTCSRSLLTFAWNESFMCSRSLLQADQKMQGALPEGIAESPLHHIHNAVQAPASVNQYRAYLCA